MSELLIEQLTEVLGSSAVQSNARRNAYYRQGFRSGSGEALAVVFPKTLRQLWQVLQYCVDAGAIIIMQAAKTGLTEGSAPNGEDYDRPVVVINTLAMDTIILLGDGEQVLSFPGATLHQLEKELKTVNRAPHSVIGSSCLGASIIGGVANNSGGALVERGPAYTEAALFAQVTAEGKLALVNHLGIELGVSAEEILTRLEQGDFAKICPLDARKTAAEDYPDRVRDVEAATPARFNADKRRLFEASGCAGKLAVFAVRLATFPVPKREQLFYIGTNDAAVFTRLRRAYLADCQHLPEVAEYMHRDVFDIAENYGKDTFLAIWHLGTARMPKLFALKSRIDAVFNKVPVLPNHFSDRVMQWVSRCFPKHLPKRLYYYREQFEHHLILRVSDEAIAEADAFLNHFFSQPENSGEFFVCSDEESQKATLNRFAAAGAAMRYEILHQKRLGGLIALDIALRRNDEDWVETLPGDVTAQIDKRLYYGHFFCHVFHQDYLLKSTADAKAVKSTMLKLLDERGAKYPAEHNVGHLYQADAELREFYEKLDPTNTFNPGVGQLSKYRRQCGCG